MVINIKGSVELNYPNNIYMSFLIKYKPFLIVYFLFGLCPFLVATSTGRIRYTKLSIFYNFIFFTTILLLLLKVNYEITSNIFRTSHIDFHVIVSRSQSIMSMFVYGSLAINFLFKYKAHANLLNGIVNLDNQIAKLCGITNSAAINLSSFYVCHSAATLFVTFMLLLFLLIPPAATTTGDDFDQLSLLLYGLQCLILLSSYLMVSHICGCALILQRRFHVILKYWDLILKNVEQNGQQQFMADTLNAVEQFFRLKIQFEKVFGFAMLLFVLLDVMLLIVIVYMYILFVIMRNVMPFEVQINMLFTYILWPLMKIVILIVVVSDFGYDVSFKYILSY